MSYRVVLTRAAEDDLTRLFDFMIERELARSAGDASLADRALEAIEEGLRLLQRHPFTCRKAAASPFTRELLISFGRTGYVALFDIVDDQTVVVGAVRHQREDDFH